MSTTEMQTEPAEIFTMSTEEERLGNDFNPFQQFFLPQCQVNRVFVLTVICLVGSLGFTGNILSAFVFWQDKKKAATVFLLLCLAIVDSCLIVFWELVAVSGFRASLAEDIDYFLHTEAYVRAYVRPVAKAMHVLTTWLTVVVATQRYFTVCGSSWAAKYASLRAARIEVAVILAVALGCCIVRLADESVVETPSGQKVTVPNGFFNDTTYVQVWTWADYVFMYIIPLLILGYVTICLGKVLRKRSKNRKKLLPGKSRKGDMTFPLMIVIVVFVICQAMNPIRNAWLGFASTGYGCDEAHIYFSQYVSVAVVFNSSFNFVIYILLSTGFREQFLKKMKGFRGICRRGTRRVAPFTIEMKASTKDPKVKTFRI